MAVFKKTKSIYYNDVNLIAQPAEIGSRKDVPLELNRIIVSPMAAVVGQTFAKEATKLGLTVCQHKFCDIDNAVINYSVVPNKENLFVSIGLNDWDRAKELASEGADNWLIDCANGYLPQIRDVINNLFNKHKVNRLMVGNVMTADGINLYSYFSKYIPEVLIRVGIAGGSACATSDATGYNRGQITEIIECSDQADIDNLKVIADGGIKNGNYAAKAFGAGADYVMMGGYFARAKEAYTWETDDGTYWGGASTKQQQLYGGVRRHSEGKVYEVDRNSVKSLQELVDDLWGGLSSAVSYSGYKSLTDFVGNGIFEVKENSLPPGR
jgi:GMP reductase